MEYLSKSAKRVLHIIQQAQPHHQGGRFYLVKELRFPQDMDPNDVEACLQRLEEAHLVKSYGPGVLALTDQGRHWPEYSGQERRDTFLKSILCPIVVTIATETILHGMPILWRWIQAMG